MRQKKKKIPIIHGFGRGNRSKETLGRRLAGCGRWGLWVPRKQRKCLWGGVGVRDEWLKLQVLGTLLWQSIPLQLSNRLEKVNLLSPRNFPKKVLAKSHSSPKCKEQACSEGAGNLELPIHFQTLSLPTRALKKTHIFFSLIFSLL